MKNIMLKDIKNTRTDIFEKVRQYKNNDGINPISNDNTICDNEFFELLNGIFIDEYSDKYFIFNLTYNVVIINLDKEIIYYTKDFPSEIRYKIKNNFIMSCCANEDMDIDFVFNFTSQDYYNMKKHCFKNMEEKFDNIIVTLPNNIKSVTKKPIKLMGISIGEKREYRVLEDIEYVNGLIVPKGFETDLASCPEILSNIFPHDGEYAQCAILHDFLYSKYNDYGINRETSDKIFYQLMKESGVDYLKALSMYRSVRLFGESHYDRPKINGDNPYEKVAIVDHTDRHKHYQEKMQTLLGKWYV